MRRTTTAAALMGAAIVAASAVAASAVPEAAADVRPFGAGQVVIGGCGPADAGADGVTIPDGSTRGFATCRSYLGPIRFFDRAGDGTVRRSEGTGATGEVLAVTADATATYLLYRTAKILYVGKRTGAGVFSARAVTGVAGALGGADIVARDGRWFGVWSVSPAGAYGSRLVEAGTDLPPRQITTPVARVTNVSPAPAYDGAVPALVWSRTGPASVGSDLWIASRVGGRWQSTALATAGGYNASSDIAVAAGIRFVTWTRDGFVVVASDRGGAWASRRFAIPGGDPNVAASTAGGAIDAVFVTYVSRSGQPFFAESRGTGGAVTGTWSGRYLDAPSDVGVFQPPAAVGGVGGKATVTCRGQGAVFTTRQG